MAEDNPTTLSSTGDETVTAEGAILLPAGDPLPQPTEELEMAAAETAKPAPAEEKQVAAAETVAKPAQTEAKPVKTRHPTKPIKTAQTTQPTETAAPVATTAPIATTASAAAAAPVATTAPATTATPVATAAAPAPDSAPIKLGKYETSEKLGEGVYGSTYHSCDQLLGRHVAIKILRGEITSSPYFIEHFRSVAQLVAALRHPNIVTMIDGGEQNGQYYMVVDYLSNGSLNDLLKDKKPLSLSRTMELLRPLAEALDYAHSRNVIHRNLKPSNVMFAEDGRLVLTDFGVTGSVNGNAGNTPPIGTPEYLAPEQILGKQVGPETDLYALGVIAYQMLSGQTPFSGPPDEVYRRQLGQKPIELQLLNPSLPPEVSNALQRALSKNPSERYATAREFVETLAQIAEKMDQDQARNLYQAAKGHVRLLQFDQAVAKLEQILAVRSWPEVETLMQECQRRKLILDEVQSLRDQIGQAQGRIDYLITAESWLQPTTQTQPKETKRFWK
jgi:hypothetical protein